MGVTKIITQPMDLSVFDDQPPFANLIIEI